MRVFLLDTNIISYLTDRSPLAEAYRLILRGGIPVISFMTLAEVLERVHRLKKKDPSKVKRILQELRKYGVLPFDYRICDIWARIRAERYQKTIATDDAWVAATAIAYGLPLVTHNARDFEGISDLTIITEYQ